MSSASARQRSAIMNAGHKIYGTRAIDTLQSISGKVRTAHVQTMGEERGHDK